MRSCKKYVRKRPGMSRYEIIGLKVPWNEQLQERGGGRVALIIQAAGERTAGGARLGRSWGKVGFDKDFVRDTEVAGRRSHNSLWGDEDFLLAGDGLADRGLF